MARILNHATIVCIRNKVNTISNPTPGELELSGSSNWAGKMNDISRAVKVAKSIDRWDLRVNRSIKPYKPATPNDPPRQAARIGQAMNGRKVGGTGKIALAMAASSRLTSPAPVPANRPASTRDPIGRDEV